MITNAVRWTAQARGTYPTYGNAMPVEPLEGYVGPDFTDHPDEVVARG